MLYEHKYRKQKKAFFGSLIYVGALSFIYARIKQKICKKHWRKAMILAGHILLGAWAVGMVIACYIADRRNRQNRDRYLRLKESNQTA